MRQLAHLFPTPEGITLAGVTIARRNRDGTFAVAGREKHIHAQLQAAYGKPVSPNVLRYIKRGAELLSQVPDEELEAAAYPFPSAVKTLSTNDVPIIAKGLMMFALTGLNDMDDLVEGKARLEKMQRTLWQDALLKTYGLPTWGELTKDDDEEDDDEDDDDGGEGDNEGSNGNNAGDDEDTDDGDNDEFNAKHPRWPAGSPDSTGGEFRPKDGSATATDSDRGSISADEVKSDVSEGAGNSTAEQIVNSSAGNNNVVAETRTEPLSYETTVAAAGNLGSSSGNGAASNSTNPSSNLVHIKGIPPDAIPYTTNTGNLSFYAPPQADWSAVYEAGQANALPLFNPVTANDAIGHFGTFDYQRDIGSNTYIDAYRNASNYGVGVYMNGAGFNYINTMEIWGLFSASMSSNRLANTQFIWTTQGWYDANSGKFATKTLSLKTAGTPP